MASIRLLTAAGAALFGSFASGAGPLEILETARGQVMMGDYQGALRPLEQLGRIDAAAAAAAGVPLDEVVYAAALARWMVVPTSLGNIERARLGFERVAEQFSDSRWAPLALRNLGRIAELQSHRRDSTDLPLARTHYRAALEHPLSSANLRHELTLRLAGTYIQEFENAEAVATGVRQLESYLHSHPDNSLAAAMWEYLGETELVVNRNYKNALWAYQQAEALGFMDPSLIGDTYWRMAALAERSGAHAAVIAGYYRKIIEQAPRSGRVFEARQRLLQLEPAVAGERPDGFSPAEVQP